jgi:serine phosphatase RsbU (regulator of sigma subunit)
MARPVDLLVETAMATAERLPTVAAADDGQVPGRTTPLPTAAELARLRALHQLHLLDTEPEEEFDRITRLAQRLFDVPVASINLIDVDRQFAKSSQGGSPGGVTGRRDAFCDHTIRTDDCTVVPDAMQDERFRDNPFVVGNPGIRFYAGTPLHAGGGHRVGALCLVDTRVRTFDADQQELLAEFGRWVEQEFAIREERRRNVAVQALLQPTTAPVLPGFRFAATSIAATGLGGDLYDWHGQDRGAHLMVADAMGHGTAAAVMATNLRASMQTVSTLMESGSLRTSTGDGASADRRFGQSLAEALTIGATVVTKYLDRADMFITCFAAHLDPGGQVGWVDAGHGLTMIVRAHGGCDHLATGGLPIGIGQPNFTVREDRLDPGDAMVVFTDGVLDMYGGSAAGSAEVERIVRRTSDPQDWVDELEARARRERPLLDDVTVVAVRRDR